MIPYKNIKRDLKSARNGLFGHCIFSVVLLACAGLLFFWASKSGDSWAYVLPSGLTLIFVAMFFGELGDLWSDFKTNRYRLFRAQQLWKVVGGEPPDDYMFDEELLKPPHLKQGGLHDFS